jgi:hypothetical protein
MPEVFQVRFEQTVERVQLVRAESEEEAIARWRSWSEKEGVAVRVLSVSRLAGEAIYADS